MFNIVVGVYSTLVNSGLNVNGAVPRLTTPANFAWGRRVNDAGSLLSDATSGAADPIMFLLVPRGTDIRVNTGLRFGPTNGNDWVLLSGDRWYTVRGVDDIGYGFANEHRCALLFPVRGLWTYPLPPGPLPEEG